MSDHSPRSPRALRAVLLALPLAFLVGCVKEKTSGNETMYSYELWVPAAIFLGGALAAPAGWALREKSGRLGWSLMLGGPIAALGFAPTMYLDHITVADDHFEVRTGFVGMATTHTVKFDDIKAIHLVAETSTGRRGRKQVNEFLLCDLKSGPSAKVPLEGKLAQAAVIPLMTKIAGRQIPIIDETGGAEQ